MVYSEVSKVQKLVSDVSGVLHDLSGEVNDLDSKQHLLRRSESEERLNLLCGILSLCLLSWATAFVLICFRVYAPPTIKYYENQIDNNHSIKPRKPTITILLPEGYMTSYTWNTSSTSSYPKLPKAIGYGMTCFDQKLYAFGTSKYNGMTVIHPNGTHRLFETRGLNPLTAIESKGLVGYGQLVAFDNYAWLLGLAYGEGFGLATFISESFLYSFAKNQWFIGPSLPVSMKHVCVVGFNRSLSLLIGVRAKLFSINATDEHDSNDFVLGYDFTAQKWLWTFQPIPYLDQSYQVTDTYHLACSIKHTKSSSLVDVLATKGWDHGANAADLFEFDVLVNSWRHKVSLQNIERRGKLVVLQGILHYFPFVDFQQQTLGALGYYFEPKNKTFHAVSDPPIVYDYGSGHGKFGNNVVDGNLHTVPCH